MENSPYLNLLIQSIMSQEGRAEIPNFLPLVQENMP